MPAWISANLGTIVICLVLCVIVFGIIAGMRRDRKNGKSSCGGDCSSCCNCKTHAHKDCASVDGKKITIKRAAVSKTQ